MKFWPSKRCQVANSMAFAVAILISFFPTSFCHLARRWGPRELYTRQPMAEDSPERRGGARWSNQSNLDFFEGESCSVGVNPRRGGARFFPRWKKSQESSQWERRRVAIGNCFPIYYLRPPRSLSAGHVSRIGGLSRSPSPHSYVVATSPGFVSFLLILSRILNFPIYLLIQTPLCCSLCSSYMCLHFFTILCLYS